MARTVVAVGLKGLWTGLLVLILMHHVEPKEPLDAPLRLLDHGPDKFFDAETFLENLDGTKEDEEEALFVEFI